MAKSKRGNNRQIKLGTQLAKVRSQVNAQMIGPKQSSFFSIPSWIDGLILNKPASKNVSKAKARFYYFGEENKVQWNKTLKEQASPLLFKQLSVEKKDLLQFSTKEGLVWMIRRSSSAKSGVSHDAYFVDSAYTHARDVAGPVYLQLKNHNIDELSIEFIGATEEEIVGVLVGLELGAYQFKDILTGQGKITWPKLYVSYSNEKIPQAVVNAAVAISSSINLARHLVNLPANILNPKSFSDFAIALFKKNKNIKTELWDQNRLAREAMNLHLAVGQGALHGPCLLKISYRPVHGDSRPPLAFVGKGITFDSGGLDIKPSSGMRWMKKDMGGSAAVLGAAYWVSQAEPEIPCDFYLALAENSVDAKSFRPGDLLKARSGTWVEISNTDAEGRLVLADALDVAIKAKEKPDAVIDVATLTGACRVALGADVGGLFSNHDELAGLLSESSHRVGDWLWRLPLVPKYQGQLKSSFADMQNSAEGGFAGAITAAMFLEKFVGDCPWAHLDVYCWSDKPQAGFTVGGNGQAVQVLASLISTLEMNPDLRFR